jgi:hypothetical protein
MLRRLYSNSGVILLAVLCAGVWFRNLRSLYPPDSFYFAYSDELLACPPIPAPSFEEQLEQEWLKLTSEDALRRASQSRRGTCSRHGGVETWLNR